MSLEIVVEGYEVSEVWVPVPDAEPEISYIDTYKDILTVDDNRVVKLIEFSFTDQGGPPSGVPPVPSPPPALVEGEILPTSTALTVQGDTLVRETNNASAQGLFIVSGTPGTLCVVTITITNAGQEKLKSV